HHQTKTSVAIIVRSILSYASARPVGRSTPRDSYSGHIAKQLRDAARADVQSITRRLKSLLPIEHPDRALRECLKVINTIIATEGTVSCMHPGVRDFRDRLSDLGIERGRPIHDLHARHYLIADDIIPFFVLLSLESGIEQECIKALRADCLRN